MDYYWYGIFIGSVIFIFWFMKSFYAQRNLPHGPLPYPVFGNLLQLKRSDIRHTLQILAHKYGPVFTIWLGRLPIVVVNDYNVAKEVFHKNGLKFSGRPNFLSDLLTRNCKRMPFMNYSQEFVMKQKICIKACQLDEEHLEKCVESEVKSLCQTFSYQVVLKEYDPAYSLEDCVMNLMSKIIYGVDANISFSDIDLPGKEDLLTIANTTNLFPWMRIFNFHKRKGFSLFVKKRDRVLNDLFEKSQAIENNKAVASIVLRCLNDECSKGQIDEANLLSSDLFVIGVENLTSAMKWLLLYLVTWPEIQLKLHEELDVKFENGKNLSVKDAMSIPYLQASVYETLRLSSLNPVAAFHMSTESVTLKGHKLPKNTCVSVNLSAIHHSPKYWDKPFEFNPGRFLEYKDNSVILRDVNNMKGFFSFGSGVRKCMGDELSIKVMTTIMANLIFNFDFEVPPSCMRPDLGGTTNLVLVPRPYTVSVAQR